MSKESESAIRNALGEIDHSLQSPAGPRQRVLTFLAALRAVIKEASLYACILDETNNSFLEVLGPDGEPQPSLTQKLGAEWQKVKREAAQDPQTGIIFRASLKLAAHVQLVQSITSGERLYGVLAIALPRAAGDEGIGVARDLLALLARQIALRLDLAAVKEDTVRLKAELAEQTHLADIGELAGQVTHKFNNFLNSLMLKIALLETELPAAMAARFADTRQLAKNMAEVIKQVHHFRRRPSPAAQVQDLNPLIKRAAESLIQEKGLETQGPLAIQLALSPEPALVSGSAVDYGRLCALLLRNRLAASGPAGTLILRTETGGDKVSFSIEDTRPNVPASALTNLFEGDGNEVGTATKLELGTAKALVRRYQGLIRAKPGEAGGLIIEMEFPKPANDPAGL